MGERLYTDHPELYDAIQAEWDYDRDVRFVRNALSRHGVDGRRLLEAGCGTGEHTRRFVAAGFDVTAVDPYKGMLDRAHRKCEAEFRQAGLPALDVAGEVDACVAIRGVINHLSPTDLRPALDVEETDRGRYARIAHHAATGGDRLEWREVVFGPDGGCLVSIRPMTPFEDGTVQAALEAVGFETSTHDGYGPGDDRTVFVAVA